MSAIGETTVVSEPSSNMSAIKQPAVVSEPSSNMSAIEEPTVVPGPNEKAKRAPTETYGHPRTRQLYCHDTVDIVLRCCRFPMMV